jgi:hypothetical protein
MDDGRLPFRYEGKHRRCKLEDVVMLKAAEDKQRAALEPGGPNRFTRSTTLCLAPSMRPTAGRSARRSCWTL